jgi:hypothetical protein
VWVGGIHAEATDGKSSRKEFLFHRQDRTCLTLAMYVAGINPEGSDALADIASRSEDSNPSSDAYVVIAGGEENLSCYLSANEAGSPTDC